MKPAMIYEHSVVSDGAMKQFLEGSISLPPLSVFLHIFFFPPRLSLLHWSGVEPTGRPCDLSCHTTALARNLLTVYLVAIFNTLQHMGMVMQKLCNVCVKWLLGDSLQCTRSYLPDLANTHLIS